MLLLNELRTAIKEQQFSVHCQPIIQMACGAIHIAEALIRWNHPSEGMISPMEFIPILKTKGVSAITFERLISSVLL
jgi:sensor c-di-GMP phosphodiesterase-like protein